MEDKRRRQYVPTDVYLAFGSFGSKLGDRWGMEGLGCWVLFLAACKRERQQGVFTYTSDAEAWSKIGPQPTGFTLDAFLTFTGQQKKTRRTRHGQVTYVVVTCWKAWNTPRGRGENPRKTPETSQPLSQDVAEMRRDVAPEVEGRSREGEGEGRSYLGLPFENELLTARLLKECEASADDGTANVLRAYAAKLSPASLAKVIESTRRIAEKDRARYANGALQSEIRESRVTA